MKMSIFQRNNILYVEFFHPGRGKKVQRSTRLCDSPENRSKIKNEILPQLTAELAILAKSPVKPQIVQKDFAYFADLYCRKIESNETWRETNAKVKKIVAYFQTLGKDPFDISANDIEGFLFSLNVSVKTMKNYRSVIGSIFKFVLKDSTVSAGAMNPVSLVELPAPVNNNDDIEPFSVDEVMTIINACRDNSRLRNYLAIAFYTGARSGEILGLMPHDIDFENKTINIQRQITKHQTKKRLKTKDSKRIIPLFSSAIPYIKEQLEAAKEKKSLYLFCREDGTPMMGGADEMRGRKNANMPDDRQGQWFQLLKACGIKYRRMYQTRHTFITNALQSGQFSVNEIAQIVGHTTAETIYKTYNRFIKSESLKVDTDIKIFNKKTVTGSCY